jgi:hypothetical protein
MMPLPSGFSAFLRRLGMVILARDERRLRFWSSRPICVVWALECCAVAVSATATAASDYAELLLQAVDIQNFP